MQMRHRKQGVTVDDNLRTSVKNIFAVGDVCSAYKFTHVADFMARMVSRHFPCVKPPCAVVALLGSSPFWPLADDDQVRVVHAGRTERLVLW